jgi:hypothetical protein
MTGYKPGYKDYNVKKLISSSDTAFLLPKTEVNRNSKKGQSSLKHKHFYLLLTGNQHAGNMWLAFISELSFNYFCLVLI